MESLNFPRRPALGQSPLHPVLRTGDEGESRGVLGNPSSWEHMELRGSHPNAEPFGPLRGTATARNTVQGWRPVAVLKSVPPSSLCLVSLSWCEMKDKDRH